MAQEEEQDAAGGQDDTTKALDATATQWSFQSAYQSMPDYFADIVDGQPRRPGLDNYVPLRIVAPTPLEKLTIFPYADPGSNTFKVRLDLPEGSAALFPGMFVKTAFVIGERRVLMIPSESVAHRSEVTGVYIVRSDGRVGFRHVRLGNSYAAGMVSVLSGLERDESVALDPIAAGTRLKQQIAEQGND